MQKLYVESDLPVSAATAWEVFESDAFRERLAAQTNLSSEILEEKQEGSVQVRRMRFVSGNELPGVVAKALGMKNLTYEQVNRFDPTTGRLDWTVHLPVLQDRVKVGGITVITDTPGGSRRVVDGTIEVNMRLIGGQVEKLVVGEFEKSMSRAVDVARELIREQKLA